MRSGRKEHWEKVYSDKEPSGLTWFQGKPETSLSFVRQAGVLPQDRILDVGGGTSHLSSFLLQEGFSRLSVLDLSSRALALAKDQLGSRAHEIEWIEADILEFEPATPWALWHDRAVFHFLSSQEEREAYCRALRRGLEPGGHLIIATFAPDGPTRCSGLECVQYSPESLSAVLGPEFLPRGSVREVHETPVGGTQNFVYSWFQREGDPREEREKRG